MKKIIPSYKQDDIISQPISIDGNVGTVRCGELISQTIVAPSVKNSPLIRAKSKSGSWVWSQIQPTSFIIPNEAIDQPGIIFVESKYGLIKYGLKANYGFFSKNEEQ